MTPDIPQMPFVIVAPDGVFWLGHARDEAHAWDICLGWPSQDEVAARKRDGWYCARATVSWKKPKGAA